VHAATIMDAYGMTIRAGALRALPDDSDFSTICDAALDSRAALAARAALASRDSLSSLDVRAALDAEKRLQIADIRELVSCPWTEPTT
jgi:hypothetical protein